MSVDYIKNIRDALNNKQDADDIMATLVDQLTDINAFKSALCDGNECKMFFPVGTAPTYPSIQKQIWRLHYKITKICAAAPETCEFSQIKEFYAARSEAMAKYNAKEIDDILKDLTEDVKKLKISGGGKQKGGNWVSIVTLIAGIEVALSKVKSFSADVYNKLCELCTKVATAIKNAPTTVPECLRSIMGDTLYKIVKNMLKGAIGYEVLNEIYANIESLQKALISIVKYIPYAAGVLTMLSIGLFAFKVAEKLGGNAPELMESAKTIVTEAVNAIDESDFDKIIETANNLKTTIVDTITQKLNQADAAQQASIAQEMEEFKTTIHEILDHATLSPESIAKRDALMLDIDDRAAAMVEQIRANIDRQMQVDNVRNQDAQAPATQAPATQAQTTTKKRTASDDLYPDTSKRIALENDEEIKDGGKSSARKTHKKPHKKNTHKKPHKSSNKKSRKHRRSRKH